MPREASSLPRRRSKTYWSRRCRLTPSANVGLPAEEYDPSDRRQLGNFPQAFSHLALINTAPILGNTTGPAELRSRRGDATTPAAAEATSRR